MLTNRQPAVLRGQFGIVYVTQKVALKSRMKMNSTEFENNLVLCIVPASNMHYSALLVFRYVDE